jgi:hypothetical protein
VLALDLSLLLLQLAAAPLLLLASVLCLACVLQRAGSSGMLLPVPSLRPLLHAFSLQLLAMKGHTALFERRAPPCTCKAAKMLVMLQQGDCRVPADTWHSIRDRWTQKSTFNTILM